jgi:hypothetical protein
VRLSVTVALQLLKKPGAGVGHNRSTARGEMPRTSAVWSPVKPAKKRNWVAVSNRAKKTLVFQRNFSARNRHYPRVERLCKRIAASRKEICRLVWQRSGGIRANRKGTGKPASAAAATTGRQLPFRQRFRKLRSVPSPGALSAAVCSTGVSNLHRSMKSKLATFRRPGHPRRPAPAPRSARPPAVHQRRRPLRVRTVGFPQEGSHFFPWRTPHSSPNVFSPQMPFAKR